MKYIIGLLIVVILVRIDFFLKLFDRASEKVQKKTMPVEQPVNVVRDEPIPFAQDKALNSSDKIKFFTLMEDFHLSPKAQSRENIVNFLKERPNLLGAELDPTFESLLFRMRDLIPQKNLELPLILNEFLNILQGKNHEVVKRFYSLYLDDGLDIFIAAYVRTKDTNCLIATMIADPVPEDTLYVLFSERDRNLSSFIGRDKIDPAQKNLAQNCQLVLRLQLSKLTPPPPPPDEGDEENAEP